MPNISKRDTPPAPCAWRWPSPQCWILLLLAAFALLTTDVLLDGPFRRADLPVSAWLTAHVHGLAWRCARALAAIGQRRLAVIPLGLAAVAVAWRRRSWRALLWTLAVLAVLGFAVDTLKGAVGRTGPGLVDRVHSGGMEYPSGHTINGIVLWGMFLRLLRDLGGPARWLTYERRWRVALLIGFAAGVGVLAINWHWLTDVIGGWLLGPPALWLALKVYGEPVDARGRLRQRARVIVRR